MTNAPPPTAASRYANDPQLRDSYNLGRLRYATERLLGLLDAHDLGDQNDAGMARELLAEIGATA